MQDLNDKFKGPLDKKNAKNTLFPFVFLLGNHSSGKSSFINYVLGHKVQVAGVAPTDDNFTIIAPGKDDQDRDGPALIGACYAVLCCAMLCYAVLCCAMLCCIMLCYGMLCYDMLCCAVLCCAMLCYAVLYYVVLWYAVL
jgi:hypothetical protein